MDRYAIIMAGGGGTRFWPLSRQQMPKQLLNISGNDVMINESIKRLVSIFGYEKILVVTNRKQCDIVKQLIVSELPRENILFEPVGRNTSTCIAYAAVKLNMRCRDAVMCVLPSDHYITGEDRFRQILLKACEAAEKTDRLVTIGIKPVFPSTGYGYIRYDPESSPGLSGVYEVEEFIEKPDAESARIFIESGNYLWNSGMFSWKLSTIQENLKRFLPRLYNNVERIREYIGTDREQDVIDSVYSKIQGISIDFGVMERSDEVLVIPGDFGWNDLGSWDALGMIFPTDENGNIVKARHIGLNTKNSIVYSNGRLIATIGLENMIIADTCDAMLICPKNRAQEVGRVVEYIRNNGLEDYL